MSVNDSVKYCPACAGTIDIQPYLITKAPDGLFSHPFTLLKCKSCDLVFLKDIVEPENLYPKVYYRNPKLSLGYFFDLALSCFIASRAALIKKYKRIPGRILDIGCGDGAFLAGMKKNGWETLAIDSSSGACEYLAKKNITLLGRDFLSANIQEKDFDAVTYWYSFEHLANPVAYLKQAHRILKDDGILIIAVQNIKSLQAVVGGRYWFHLDLPRHILHFSPHTLTNLLCANGFNVLKIEHRSVQMNIFGWYQSLLNILGFPQNMTYKLTKREAMPSDTALPPLLMALATFPFIFSLSVALAKIEELFHRGGIITIIARKCL